MIEEFRTLTEEVLKDAHLLALGVNDTDGPWVSSVTFVFDKDFNIYWLSKEEARHSKAVLATGKGAGSIVAEHTKKNERAVQIEGTVEKIDVPLFEQEKALRAKEGGIAPQTPGETTGTHSWYKLTPTRLELIYGERFGWDRKRVL